MTHMIRPHEKSVTNSDLVDERPDVGVDFYQIHRASREIF